jgi:MFS family permease
VLARARTLSLPTSLAALAVPQYRLWLSSQVLATTGLWMQRIAQDWLVLELTGSVAAVGIAVALQFLPVLLFGLVGGLIVDRFPKRRLLMVTQAAAALLALALGAMTLTGVVAAWHVYVIAALLGCVTVVDNPARQVFVSELVGDRLIGNAVSLNSSVFQLGALVGPALSGLLIKAVGEGWSFLVNAATCLVVVGMVTLIRPAIQAPSQRSGQGRSRGGLREGLRYLRNTSEVAWAVVLVAALGVLGLNLPVVLAAFADVEFHTGVGGYSLYNTFGAIGALIGALLSTRRRGAPRLRTLVTLLGLEGAVMALASLAPNSATLCAVQVLSGLLTLLFLTGANSLVQLSSRPDVRGRVMSVYLLLLLGGQAIGNPLVGLLVDHAGARLALALCGALIGLAAVAAGLAIAHRSRLAVSVDLHREHGRWPLHIVPSQPGTSRTLVLAGHSESGPVRRAA